MTKTETVDAEELDRIFDDGGDMIPYVKINSVRFPGGKDSVRKVNGSIPEWVIEEMENEARHLAVSRSAVMNMWLAEKAKECRKERAVV